MSNGSLFGFKMIKDTKTRLSNWNQRTLTEVQVHYALLDNYAHWLCYEQMLRMPYVDPKTIPPPRYQDLKEGHDVLLLYTSNLSVIVARGIYIHQKTEKDIFGRPYASTSKVMVQVNLSNVTRPAAVVHCIDEETSLTSLFGDATTIEVPWKLRAVRLSTDTTGALEQPLVPAKRSVQKTTVAATDDNTTDRDENDSTNEGEVCGPLHLGVKQDIEHIFIRFSKKLSKAHGAFGAFMSRLSDAFFVPSQDDIEFIKEALQKVGVSDEEINKKKWTYYKRRVRRSVPQPEELAREFIRVVQLFADVEDAKTGKPLFSKEAWNLYRSSLKHIRTGCLSDIEDMTYYIQIWEDSLGIPLFKCVRGTSALEGLHQKI